MLHYKHHKNNLKALLCSEPDPCFRFEKGKLVPISKKKATWLHRLTLGHHTKKVQKAMLWHFGLLCNVIETPLTPQALLKARSIKIKMAQRLLDKWATVNGKPFPKNRASFSLEIYESISLTQQRETAQIYDLCQEKTPLQQEAQNALNRGFVPYLVGRGVNGTYVIKTFKNQKIGIFKPWDEGVFTPHNPGGLHKQHAIGVDSLVGFSSSGNTFREVAAYLVNVALGHELVPLTVFATLSSPYFLRPEPVIQDHYLLPTPKVKRGSLQAFVEGKPPQYLNQLLSLPAQLIHKLAILDIICGNSDRNPNNLLLAEDRLYAIDHGFCFSEVPLHVQWVWKELPQLFEPLDPILKQKVMDLDPKKLYAKLQKACRLSALSLKAMTKRLNTLKKEIESKNTLQSYRRYEEI